MFNALIKNLRNHIPRSSLLGQFLRYLVTGGLAFVADFGLFALCLYVFEWHYLVANLVGLVVGLVINYAISIAWVFSACKRTLEKKKSMEFGIFAIIGVAGVGLNQLCMFLMIGKWEWQEMLSKVIAAAIVLMWNFLARKLILFRTKNECV